MQKSTWPFIEKWLDSWIVAWIELHALALMHLFTSKAQADAKGKKLRIKNKKSRIITLDS
jgi:hypothetical protein